MLEWVGSRRTTNLVSKSTERGPKKNMGPQMGGTSKYEDFTQRR
uniref:Uncharacterized protein n=1 Tax=Rhizophora mucronata TaxID=61149 RepID=A0A2P2P6S1_RHIMU